MKITMTKVVAMLCLLGFNTVCFGEETKGTEVSKPAAEEAQISAEDKAKAEEAAKAAAEEKAKASAAAAKAKADAEHGHSHD